jgi:hypothetical protein
MPEQIADIQMSYEGLVEAGREARKQIDGHQWAEGDLALQVEALTPESRPRDPETGEFIEDQNKVLRRYADDIDMSYRTLKEYRRTAEAWPVSRRGDAGFEVHKLLAAQSDRFDVIHEGMTKREAEQIVRKRNAASTHPPGWYELIGEVADTLNKASKQLERAEEAIDREPKVDFKKRAGRYAGIAEGIAERLRAIESW